MKRGGGDGTECIHGCSQVLRCDQEGWNLSCTQLITQVGLLTPTHALVGYPNVNSVGRKEAFEIELYITSKGVLGDVFKCDKRPQGKVTRVTKRIPSVRFLGYGFIHVWVTEASHDECPREQSELQILTLISVVMWMKRVRKHHGLKNILNEMKWNGSCISRGRC